MNNGGEHDDLLDDEYAALAARKGRRPLTERIKLSEEMRWRAQWEPKCGRYYFEDRQTGKSQWEPPEMWKDAFEDLQEIADLQQTTPQQHAASCLLVRFLKAIIFKKELASLRRTARARASSSSSSALSAGRGDGVGGLKSALQLRKEVQETTASKVFTKHLDEGTGRFYYILQQDSAHPAPESTWDKPHRAVPLERPDPQRRAGVALEDAIRRRQRRMVAEERRVLLRIRRRDHEHHVKAERRRLGAAEVNSKNNNNNNNHNNKS